MCTREYVPRLHAKPVAHYRRNVRALRVGGLREAAEEDYTVYDTQNTYWIVLKYAFLFLQWTTLTQKATQSLPKDRMCFLLRGSNKKRRFNVNMRWIRKPKFQGPWMSRNEKMSKALTVGQPSYITHLKIKSETGFWQARYFLQCQEPYNRPFFYSLFGQSSSNAWKFRWTESRSCSNTAYPFLPVPPLTLLETIADFLSLRKGNILCSVVTCL